MCSRRHKKPKLSEVLKPENKDTLRVFSSQRNLRTMNSPTNGLAELRTHTRNILQMEIGIDT